MIHYDFVHDVSITVPLADGTKAGTFAYIGNDGYLYNTLGETPIDGYCSQVRGNYATLRVHGVVTMKYIGTDPTCGTRGLSIDENGNLISDNTNGRKFLILSVDKKKKLVTFML